MSDQQQNNNESSLIQEALQDYKNGLKRFSEKIPHLSRKYHAFTDACFADGSVAKKEKQMIALAISVFAQDEYCIIFHTKGCLDEGCTEKEILETVGVAAAFGGGAAVSQAVTLVQDAVDELTKEGSTSSS